MERTSRVMFSPRRELQYPHPQRAVAVAGRVILEWLLHSSLWWRSYLPQHKWQRRNQSWRG
ncbi:unnamed protein product [Amoebophrya sp. A120]|nr:unnamed protein product [Amoebophrya sp. A120]|eukprot:GSA120T00020447001.1